MDLGECLHMLGLEIDAETSYMKSQNFEFLRMRHAVLADLAGFAERYAHEDPSSLIKQRSLPSTSSPIYTTHACVPIFRQLQRLDDC